MVVFVEKWCQALFVSTVIYLFLTQTRFAIYMKIIIFVIFVLIYIVYRRWGCLRFLECIYIQYKTRYI